MSKSEIAMALAEIMATYNAKKAEWVKANGTEDGFDAWFTAQVRKA